MLGPFLVPEVTLAILSYSHIRSTLSYFSLYNPQDWQATRIVHCMVPTVPFLSTCASARVHRCELTFEKLCRSALYSWASETSVTGGVQLHVCYNSMPLITSFKGKRKLAHAVTYHYIVSFGRWKLVYFATGKETQPTNLTGAMAAPIQSYCQHR